jgi:hypothetical protein
VLRACQPGGALHPALLAGGYIDAAHEATKAFIAAGARGPERLAVVLVDETAIAPSDAAREAGVPEEAVLRDMGGPLAPAVVPIHHLSARTFAWLSGASVDDVLAAAEDELEPALTPSLRIDLSHAAALEYLAARPFKRKRNGDPSDCPEGFLAPACVGDDIDFNSPFARAWLARLDGVAPTDESVEAMVAGAAVA